MSYYILAEKTERFGWTVQFGDKDKETVNAERDDYVSNGAARKNLKVVTAKSSRKSDCDAAIASLNAKEA